MSPNLVYLAQTDTTVGFLSQNGPALQATKNRPGDKPFLIALDSFESLKKQTRIPKAHQKQIRRSTKTTFVLPNQQAYRVVKDQAHLHFLQRFGWMHSTSANPSGGRFDIRFAKDSADVIVEGPQGFRERESSQILRLTKKKSAKIRA